MFNTDHYSRIKLKTSSQNAQIIFYDLLDNDEFIYALSKDLTIEERRQRYHDLVEKLTGERIDG
jgi:hypothetical protein